MYDYWSIKAQDARGGIEQALVEGTRKGREEERYDIARSMLAKGIDVETVKECTGLSAADLDGLTVA
jgi:predicted transposase/invertase (TIGR01784 family)